MLEHEHSIPRGPLLLKRKLLAPMEEKEKQGLFQANAVDEEEVVEFIRLQWVLMTLSLPVSLSPSLLPPPALPPNCFHRPLTRPRPVLDLFCSHYE